MMTLSECIAPPINRFVGGGSKATSCADLVGVYCDVELVLPNPNLDRCTYTFSTPQTWIHNRTFEYFLKIRRCDNPEQGKFSGQ